MSKVHNLWIHLFRDPSLPGLGVIGPGNSAQALADFSEEELRERAVAAAVAQGTDVCHALLHILTAKLGFVTSDGSSPAAPQMRLCHSFARVALKLWNLQQWDNSLHDGVALSQDDFLPGGGVRAAYPCSFSSCSQLSHTPCTRPWHHPIKTISPCKTSATSGQTKSLPCHPCHSCPLSLLLWNPRKITQCDKR